MLLVDNPVDLLFAATEAADERRKVLHGAHASTIVRKPAEVLVFLIEFLDLLRVRPVVAQNGPLECRRHFDRGVTSFLRLQGLGNRLGLEGDRLGEHVLGSRPESTVRLGSAEPVLQVGYFLCQSPIVRFARRRLLLGANRDPTDGSSCSTKAFPSLLAGSFRTRLRSRAGKHFVSSPAQIGSPISEHLDQGLQPSCVLVFAVPAVLQEDSAELGFQPPDLLSQRLPLDVLCIASLPDGLFHLRFRHDVSHRRELANYFQHPSLPCDSVLFQRVELLSKSLPELRRCRQLAAQAGAASSEASPARRVEATTPQDQRSSSTPCSSAGACGHRRRASRSGRTDITAWKVHARGQRFPRALFLVGCQSCLRLCEVLSPRISVELFHRGFPQENLLRRRRRLRVASSDYRPRTRGLSPLLPVVETDQIRRCNRAVRQDLGQRLVRLRHLSPTREVRSHTSHNQ